MHIGSFVQKRGSKETLGIITGRTPIHGCWNVLWTQGNNQGRDMISREDDLIDVKMKK